MQLSLGGHIVSTGSVQCKQSVKPGILISDPGTGIKAALNRQNERSAEAGNWAEATLTSECRSNGYSKLDTLKSDWRSTYLYLASKHLVWSTQKMYSHPSVAHTLCRPLIVINLVVTYAN